MNRIAEIRGALMIAAGTVPSEEDRGLMDAALVTLKELEVDLVGSLVVHRTGSRILSNALGIAAEPPAAKPATNSNDYFDLVPAKPSSKPQPPRIKTSTLPPVPVTLTTPTVAEDRARILEAARKSLPPHIIPALEHLVNR